MPEKNFLVWENLLNVLAIFAFLALVIERALYQIFDSRLWLKFEEVMKKQTGSDYLDLKPYISAGISIWIVFQLKLDMIAQVYQRTEPSASTMILTGLFIAGGSTGIYKFFKRARKLKEAMSKEKLQEQERKKENK